MATTFAPSAVCEYPTTLNQLEAFKFLKFIILFAAEQKEISLSEAGRPISFLLLPKAAQSFGQGSIRRDARHWMLFVVRAYIMLEGMRTGRQCVVVLPIIMHIGSMS